MKLRCEKRFAMRLAAAECDLHGGSDSARRVKCVTSRGGMNHLLSSPDGGFLGGPEGASGSRSDRRLSENHKRVEHVFHRDLFAAVSRAYGTQTARCLGHPCFVQDLAKTSLTRINTQRCGRATREFRTREFLGFFSFPGCRNAPCEIAA